MQPLQQRHVSFAPSITTPPANLDEGSNLRHQSDGLSTYQVICMPCRHLVMRGISLTAALSGRITSNLANVVAPPQPTLTDEEQHRTASACHTLRMLVAGLLLALTERSDAIGLGLALQVTAERMALLGMRPAEQVGIPGGGNTNK